MRFLTLLRSGVSLETVAKNFVTELLEKSWVENCLCLELACDFVHDILLAIGLTCHVTPEQINNNNTYVWPIEQIQIYSFHYNETDFQKLEKFLLLMCSNVMQNNEIFFVQLEFCQEDDKEPPLVFLMELMAVWCSVYRQLLKLEELQTFKRFEEPFARINFQLLQGMHDMRKVYGLEIPLLHAICDRLYLSVLQGLFYKECHEMIFTGLLHIISKDYEYFFGKSTKNKNFFFKAFSVEINSPKHLTIYQELQKILLKNVASTNDVDDDSGQAINSNKLNILINALIEPSMLKVYFTTLVEKKKGKFVVKTQKEALKFLNILQSKLLTLDCFSRDFMEGILYLILKTDSNTSALASTLYINMMNRKFPEQILKHIMDFYVAHFGSIEYLKFCMSTMYDSFNFVLNFKNFLEIITDTNTEEIIKLLSAHMLVKVFEIKSNQKDSASKQEVKELLQILPELFRNLQCQKIMGILMQVFAQMSIQDIEKPTIDNFIHIAMEVFTQIEINLEYPVLINMFNIFHKCLKFNHEWDHLALLTDHLIILYREMIKELKIIEDTQNEALFKRKLSLYNSLLKRLNIILKTKYDLLDICLLEILTNVSKYFLFNGCLQSVITAEKTFIDLYALEICLSCIMKLSKPAVTNQNVSSLTETKELLKYVWFHIQSMDNLFKWPVVRIKTYFISLLQLYTYLPLKFENNVYHQLVQILIYVNFKKSKSFNRKFVNELQQLHPMQSLEYQRLMLKQFSEMHKFPHVEINTNMVWKLCIYYGMPKNKFNEELKQLLITLANYRLKIYKNIISVLIYNLYKQNPPLKSPAIVTVLKKHIHLIDNEIRLESPNLLKVHVVLLLLQINEKALTVQRIKIGNNRLEALKHLNIFIENLDLNQLQAKQLMEEQLSNYQKHLLTENERKYVDNFTRLITM